MDIQDNQITYHSVIQNLLTMKDIQVIIKNTVNKYNTNNISIGFVSVDYIEKERDDLLCPIANLILNFELKIKLENSELITEIVNYELKIAEASATQNLDIGSGIRLEELQWIGFFDNFEVIEFTEEVKIIQAKSFEISYDFDRKYKIALNEKYLKNKKLIVTSHIAI